MTASAELVTATIPYARTVAGRVLSPACVGAQRDDLIADGMVGLVQAARTFKDLPTDTDAERARHFRAYAAVRVRGAVLDSLRAMDTMTRAERRTARLSDTPTPEALRAPIPFSAFSDNVEAAATAARTPAVPLTHRGLSPAVVAAVRTLPKRDRAIFLATTANGRTLRDVAEDYGLSESGVCRIRAKCLAAVRRYLDATP